MQPRDFGLRMSGNNKDLAEVEDTPICGQSMSFARLAEPSHIRRKEKWAKANIWRLQFRQMERKVSILTYLEHNQKFSIQLVIGNITFWVNYKKLYEYLD